MHQPKELNKKYTLLKPEFSAQGQNKIYMFIYMVSNKCTEMLIRDMVSFSVIKLYLAAASNLSLSNTLG